MNSNIRLAGALDDERGRTVAVYQDHDGVRIDTGTIEIMLSRGGAGRLIGLLEAADADAGEFALEAAIDRGLAGKPADPELDEQMRGARLTDAKQLELIGAIIDRYTSELEAPAGDKHLTQSGLLLEAIEAVLASDGGNRILRMFTGADDA